METEALAPRRGRPPLNRVTPRQEFSINAPAPVRLYPRVPPEISRLTLQDWDVWGEWLLGRTNFYWPGLYNPSTLKGQLATWSSSNDFLLIKNTDAVLMAIKLIDPLSRRVVVLERFGWSRHAKPIGERRMGIDKGGDGALNLMALYRFCRDWARGQNVVFMLSGWSSDCALSDLTETLKGDWVDWIISK